MHFQLYFPGVTREDHSLLESIQTGLSAKTSWFKQDRGPDGGSGMFVSWDGSMYVQDACRWVPAAADPEHELAMGRYLLGVPVAKPCRPKELEWPHQFEGLDVKLGDGNEWKCAAAGRLPQVFRKDPRDGRLISQVRAEFAAYWQEACEWYERILFADAGLEVPADYWTYAVRVLQKNYRLPPELVSEMGLLDSQNFIAVALASLDGMRIKERDDLKKKEAPVG